MLIEQCPSRPESLKEIWKSHSYTVHDLKLSHFFPKKLQKNVTIWEHLQQKIVFLDYNKTKKAKSVTIWGHGLYYTV